MVTKNYIKKLMMVTLLLLAVSVKGDPVSKRFDSIKVAVNFRLTNPSGGTDKATDAILSHFVNFAYSDVCSDLNAIYKTTYLYPVNDDATHSIASDFDHIHSVSKQIGDTVRVPLRQLSPEERRALYADEQALAHQMGDPFSPGAYRIVGNRLIFEPRYAPETNEDTFFVEYYAQGTFLSDASDTVEFDNTYLIDAVIWRACYLISAFIYEDYARAGVFDTLYARMVGTQ